MSERQAPVPGPSPIRRIFVLNSVSGRWPFALRAGFCMAVPAAIGWAVGDITAGLLATIGGFTSLYGSGRPYLNRSAYLGVVAASFGAAVTLGDWASAVPWLGVLTVSAIAVAAVLVCHALSIGPPGAYLFVLACAAGSGAIPPHVPPWHVGLLVLSGGAFASLTHMAGAVVSPRGPEKAAVAAAALATAQYIEAIGGGARRRGARPAPGRAPVTRRVEHAGHLPARAAQTRHHLAPAAPGQPTVARAVRPGDERRREPRCGVARRGGTGPEDGHPVRL